MSVLDFIDESKKSIKDVVATAVGLKGLDIQAVREIALRKKVRFKLRQYNDVG